MVVPRVDVVGGVMSVSVGGTRVNKCYEHSRNARGAKLGESIESGRFT